MSVVAFELDHTHSLNLVIIAAAGVLLRLHWRGEWPQPRAEQVSAEWPRVGR